MAILITLPILLPLTVSLLLLTVTGNERWQRFGLVAGSAANLVAAIAAAMVAITAPPVLLQVGGWAAPVGISLYLDGLAATMTLVSAIVGFCGGLFAVADLAPVLLRRRYASAFLGLLAGVNGAFLTGDLFNLFVWFEVILMASFTLLVIGRGRQLFRGASKYVALNVVSSFFFLCAAGLVYGTMGTLNLADLSARLAVPENQDVMLTSAALLFLAFAVKAGAFPLNFWLPPAYPQTNFATLAVFGGLLTKVGVYALVRIFGSVLVGYQDVFGPTLAVLGIATMVTGVVAAMSQLRLRRILSFHVISQIGYMLVGLSLFTAEAIGVVVFYAVHHIVVKTNLLLAAGLIARQGHSEDLTRVGGLLRRRPELAVIFVVPALSLAGLPPFSGFFAKFFMMDQLLIGERWVSLGAMALVSFLTLFSMVKIWDRAFWEKPRTSGEERRTPPLQLVAVGSLSLLTVMIGLGVGPLREVARLIGAQLLMVEIGP